MRYKFVFLLFLSLNAIVFGQKFKTPDEYLSYIKSEEINISESNWKYTSAIAHKNWIQIDEAKKNLIKTLQNAKKKIGKLKEGYNGDVEYKNQIIKYFDYCEKTLNEEYDKIIDLKNLEEQSNDAMDAYMQLDDLVNAKLDSENQKVDLAYRSFATKYNIELVNTESEWSKKIKVYNEVCAYHTSINLICFKLNFTDETLLRGILNGDLGAIQQNANALIQYANEGLSTLNTIEPYDGDYSLINSAKKVFEYYKKQAEAYVPSLINFIMYADKFDNAKKTLESKSKADRTAEEENNFNNMTIEIDKEIIAIKKIILDNAMAKSDVLLQWKSSGDDFIIRHIPKD